MDTSDSMLPGQWPSPAGGSPVWEPPEPPRKPRFLAVVAVCLATVVVGTTVAAGVIRIPYDSVAPGSAKVVNDVVTISGHQEFRPSGQVLYTTVSVRERVSLLQALIGWLDPTVDVIKEKDLRGNVPADQYRQLNVEAMSDSKTTAEVLALSHIGITNLGVGAQVDSVAPNTPAATALAANDVIVGIDGTTIATSDDAVKAIQAHQPGDTITLRVVNGNDPPVDKPAQLARADDGKALLGVRLSTKIHLPFEVTIDSGQVVGPSAGLAYALELLDLLTPGELTGGRKVAATGELDDSGAVGAIGGIAQKVVTVKRAGATVFIVPKDNEAEAKAHAGKSLQIIGVSSFDDALKALGTIQGSNAQALAKAAANPS